MKFGVVGSWHLATVMGTCFAEKGHQVIGVDSDEEAVAQLASGHPTVFEPKMTASLRKGLKSGRLRYTTDFAALRPLSLVFLAIDTPITDIGVDLTPIFEATRSIASAMKRPWVLAVTSQVPIGTCEQLEAEARAAGPKCDVVCNPEFLRLGGAMELFRKADRVIIGSESRKAAQKVEKVFAPFKRPVLTMSLREAEITKHATNAYVANSVSFIGEIAQICDEYGADAMPVSKALKLDRRVGRFAYVRPGLGFNGGTVKRDVQVLVALAGRVERKAPMLEAILAVNDRQNGQILERLREVLGKTKGRTVALLGLTYKAQTSTLRHSLTLKIARQMKKAGLVLKAYDPIIPTDSEIAGKGIALYGSLEEVVRDADAAVIMVDKPEFKNMNLRSLGKRMNRRILVDAFNLYDPAAVKKAGFTHIAIGRGFRSQ